MSKTTIEVLTPEQESILRHTARNGRFCGGGKETETLTAMGMMVCLGRVSWVPEPYYGLSSEGREWLRLNPPKEISRR